MPRPTRTNFAPCAGERSEPSLTRLEFQDLAAVPPEVDWFAQLDASGCYEADRGSDRSAASDDQARAGC